jgi:4'-phosphopantetheinyl transferase
VTDLPTPRWTPAASTPRVVGRDPLPSAVGRGSMPGEPHTWVMSLARYAAGMRPNAADSILAPEERARADRLVQRQGRTAYTAAHLGLRQLLGAYLDLDPASVAFTREACPGCGGAHGRPAAPGGLHFNMSYSGDLVVFAFASSRVGVDVETVRQAHVFEQITPSLHPDERAELASLHKTNRAAAVARCWVRKEAHLKAIGIGLCQDPADAYVGALQQPARLHTWTLADVRLPQVRHRELDAHYAAAVSAEKHPLPVGATEANHRPFESADSHAACRS